MGELLNEEKSSCSSELSIAAVIGPGCSSACEVTSYLSAGQNIPQISASCTAPSLSSKDEHPLFSRTVAPETSKGPAIIALMRVHKWQRVSMVTTTEGLWFESGLGLTKQLQAAGIEVQKPSAFEPGQFQAAMLREMKRSGFRISMLLAYGSDITAVADHATLEGMNGAGYAWILTEGLVARVPGDMEGWLYVQVSLPSVNMQAFAEQVTDYSHSLFGIPLSSAQEVDLTYSQTLYDAIMLYAHAATKVLSEGGDLRDGQAVTAAARNTTFVGVGGSVVALDTHGDRIE